MYILSMILLIFFAIIGLCAFITAIMDLSCRGSGDAELVLKSLTAENAEARIRSAARIAEHHRGIRVICICGDDDPVKQICYLMQKEFPFIEVKGS